MTLVWCWIWEIESGFMESVLTGMCPRGTIDTVLGYNGLKVPCCVGLKLQENTILRCLQSPGFLTLNKKYRSNNVLHTQRLYKKEKTLRRQRSIRRHVVSWRILKNVRSSFKISQDDRSFLFVLLQKRQQ